MKWIVTGGCGFVGCNLIKHLIQSDDNEIIVYDNLSSVDFRPLQKVYTKDVYMNESKNKNRNLSLVINDIKDFKSLSSVCMDADIIVHLAARSGVRESLLDPRTWMEDNIIGTFNILEAARENNIKKVIFASSSATVGDVNPPVDETMISNPISPYGATKASCESLLQSYYHSYGIETISLRFSNVYGPYSKHKLSVVAHFINQFIHKDVINIFGDGEQTRDFIHVDDLVYAILKLSETDIGGEIFQLSSCIEKTINKITELIGNMCEEKNIINDYQTYVKYTDPIKGDIKTNFADNSKIKSMIEWAPTIDLYEGISDLIDWFYEEYDNENRISYDVNKK